MSAEVENRAGLPHCWFEKAGPGGEVFDVLVVRGTFEFDPSGGALTLAGEQQPIRYGDEFEGAVESNPLRAVLAREGDLVLFKPTTDVYVTGTAYARGRLPARSWTASLSVGPVSKILRLYGRRWFEKRGDRWRLTDAEPTTELALDYRRAFGGSFSAHAGDGGTLEHVYKPDNPAGCGWLPDDKSLETLSKHARQAIEAEISGLPYLDAPRIEDPRQPVEHPKQDAAAQGFGPIARWCSTRLQHAGTYDDDWRASVYPRLPDDFDPRFYQSAPPDLICREYLDGDEPIDIVGICADGPLRGRLPGVHVLAATTTDAGARRGGRLLLDTVAIDVNALQVGLVWRATFERADPVRRVALGMMSDSAVSAIAAAGAV
jgi:hypothetical protein